MTLPSSDLKTKQSDISSFVGKVLRDHFGKGPGSVYVSISDPFVTIYVKDLMSATERVLYSGNHEKTLKKTREFVMDKISDEIKSYIKTVTDIDVQRLYYDWSLENQSGVFLGVGPFSRDATYAPYSGQDTVHDEIILMSEKVEKRPEKIFSLRVNDRTLIVVREGLLVEIEKQLIHDGHQEVLRLSKGKIEKRMLNVERISSKIECDIEDYFIDWDFKKDQSFTIFIMKPNN
ncbi:Na-translocating system protein MpsC family protein [Pseudalkalibacillus sp. Hm43]|uniref:Na-translocating system protein MpsC family protein n=1 Tax=Pseudalkalibacillus sp. Hm43 TaxID=3450742 RepID=UPI003F421474